MRVAIINKTPKEWLRGLGLTPLKIMEIINSFEPGSDLRVGVYKADHAFVRFHGAGAKSSMYQPNYWVDVSAIGSAFGRASQFEGWLTDAQIVKIAKNYYREICAICRN